MNEYGKVIIEDIQINDSKIIYTYYTEGFVPYESGLVFFDENEKEIIFYRFHYIRVKKDCKK